MSRSWDSDQLLFIVGQDRKREILRLFNMGEIELERSRLQGCRGFDTWTSLGIKPLTRLLEHASWYPRRWIGFMGPQDRFSCQQILPWIFCLWGKVGHMGLVNLGESDYR